MMYRRRPRRSRTLGNVVQSYKQIYINGPASGAASTNIDSSFANGVDNYSGPTANNNEVPTGAVIKEVDCQVALSNLVAVTDNVVISIQHTRSGQTPITANAQGGNPQRNQVHYTKNIFVGKEQNTNLHWKFKIPKKYQRVREGDNWYLTLRSDQTFAYLVQCIYKFYR